VEPLNVETSKFVRLKSLRCFGEARRWIVSGRDLAAVAEMIHKNGEYKDLPQQKLEQVLKAFRDTIPPVELLGHMLPEAAIAKASNAISDGIDVLDELKKLYKLQRERIDIDFEKEKMIGKLFGNMPQEMYVAKGLLESIRDTEAKLGLTKNVLGELHLYGGFRERVAASATTRVAQALEDPQSRNRLRSVLERYAHLEKLEQEAVIEVEAESK
jgi:hypothetical protein